MTAETEMVERVARALHEANDRRTDKRFRVAWDDCLPAYREMILEDARAAIEAMHDIDDSIADAMNDVAIDGPEHASFYPSFSDCKALFAAAIDAALSPPSRD